MEQQTPISTEFEECKLFPNYEVRKDPLTIRVKHNKVEVSPKKKNDYLSVRLDKDDVQLAHVISGQYLNFEKGDVVRFKNKKTKYYDISDYNLDNLIVKKRVGSNSKEIESSDEDIPVKEYTNTNESNEKIKWSDVSEYKIEVKDSFNIRNFTEMLPLALNSRNDIIECICLMRCVFAAVHSTPEIFIFKDQTSEGFKISNTNETIAKQKLNKMKIGRSDGKELTAWDVYKQYPDLFTYDYIAFCGKDDSRVFSLFQGYKYNEV